MSSILVGTTLKFKIKKSKAFGWKSGGFFGRRGQPGDIAKAAVFLAPDDAVWITGEQISVSGGMYGF